MGRIRSHAFRLSRSFIQPSMLRMPNTTQYHTAAKRSSAAHWATSCHNNLVNCRLSIRYCLDPIQGTAVFREKPARQDLLQVFEPSPLPFHQLDLQSQRENANRPFVQTLPDLPPLFGKHT